VTYGRDEPTFSRPARPVEYVPGKIILRFEPKAVRPHVAEPRLVLNADGAGRLPDSVAEPLEYLRANAGLEAVDPVFSARRRFLRRRGLKAAEQQLLAVGASVVDVDEDARAVGVLTLKEKRIDSGLLKRISASPAVAAAERLPARWLLRELDPKRNRQWGLAAVNYFHARRPSARNVRVAVLDSGIDTTHPDLPRPVVHRHSGFRTDDPAGHGTHVAGIIAAKANNGIGIAGIADCALGIWKIFPDDPDDPYVDSESFLRALGEVVDERMQIVNLSIGGTARSDIEADLFAEAIAAGVTFVAAMGNDFLKGNPVSYPAAYDDVISVGATTRENRRSAFSSSGAHIDLVAPGSEIFSTVPMGRSVQRNDTEYASWDGTSMATPHVAAAAALLVAEHPRSTPADVARRLRESASGVPEMDGQAWTPEHGYGLLDLRRALS
jgi:subtilisin family serine protease